MKRDRRRGLTLEFAGTRGEIDARTRRHRRHSCLVIVHRGKRIIIDCGRDWFGKIDRLRPDAIVLTHAHPDHAWGLKQGAPGAVYAAPETWSRLKRFPFKRWASDSESTPALPATGWRLNSAVESPACPGAAHSQGARFFIEPVVEGAHEIPGRPSAPNPDCVRILHRMLPGFARRRAVRKTQYYPDSR